MIVRKATIKDIPALMKLWKEFIKDHDMIVLKENPHLKPHILKKKDAPDIAAKFIKSSIRSKKSRIFIVEVNGELAGYCLTYIADINPIHQLRKIGFIGDFFVKKEFRRRKIGSNLMEEAIKWLRKKDIKYVSLGIFRDNKRAHSIYKKWGFFDYRIEMRKRI